MPKHEGIHKLFSQAAKKFGNHTAITQSGRNITYDELEDRSNGLAQFLLSEGFIKGGVIAILAERAAEIITAIIGSLKAGGVFVPLNSDLPPHRLRAQIDYVTPEWFLVESKFIRMLGELAAPLSGGVKALALDDEVMTDEAEAGLRLFSTGVAYCGARDPAVIWAPDDMCYVYFTSGSTGQPKGIAGRLKAIDHFIRWEIETLRVSEGTRVSQLTAPTFDAYLRDVFVPLCAGGTVCVPDDKEMALNAGKLIGWLDEQRINIIHCVPSLFRSMVQHELRPEYFPALKYILMSGETLPPPDVKKWMRIFGERVQLVNLYGPSETTMVKFFHFVRPEDTEARSIPIGKPIDGAKAVIVDEGGRICSPGKVGEIYIRTPYRSLGYYRQPELTAQSFVPNPFNPAHDPNDIVYKTGDLGRVLEDGNFEIIGRKDRQLKLRGVRIEPAEVENVLREHQAVRDVAVVDWLDAMGEQHLCAYVVTGGEASPESLRDYLSEKLPTYLIPNFFVNLDKLPLTPHGKLDRAALPVPEAATPNKYAVPETEIERAIASIWRETLGLERVGRHDNFFDIGGNSMKLVRAHVRLSERFGSDLSLMQLLQHPTVKTLATFLSQRFLEADLSEEISDRAAKQRKVFGRARRQGRCEADAANDETL